MNVYNSWMIYICGIKLKEQITTLYTDVDIEVLVYYLAPVWCRLKSRYKFMSKLIINLTTHFMILTTFQPYID